MNHVKLLLSGTLLMTLSTGIAAEQNCPNLAGSYECYFDGYTLELTIQQQADEYTIEGLERREMTFTADGTAQTMSSPDGRETLELTAECQDGSLKTMRRHTKNKDQGAFISVEEKKTDYRINTIGELDIFQHLTTQLDFNGAKSNKAAVPPCSANESDFHLHHGWAGGRFQPLSSGQNCL